MSRIKLSRQSDLNIGTAGHVDHGKCITGDTPIYVYGYGDIRIERILSEFEDIKLMYSIGSEEVYSSKYLYIISLDRNHEFRVSRGYLYRQCYRGPVFKVVTETGRVVRLSPRHRVPIVSGRGTVWLDASSLVVGYDILLSNYARLIRYCDTGVLSGQNSLLSVERIESIDEEFYDGYLYDLSVPTYHNFVGGFGGFILHNTTIIEALTGIWTSSHSEELRRGITIRIGYADMPIYRFKAGEEEVYWSYPEFGGYSEGELVRVVSFVDCPGHESLMANMLSGATVMDGAMLVIAANESVPRPQTKEHAMALQILGVKSVVVVQNKLDLVSKEEARRNYEEIVEFLSTTEFADAPIIPVSAIHKVNLHYLVEALYRYIPLPKRDLAKPFRMYVIRSFDINKPGTRYRDLRGGVIGGSILQGKVKIGDEIEILPGYLYSEDGRIINKPLYANVQSIRTQHASLKEAYGGGLIGIQTDLDPYLTKSDNLVGNIAGEPGSLPPVRNEFDMEYELFKYVVGTDETIEVKPLSVNERLRLNVGPAVTLGIVTSIGPDNIHVRLHRPVVAEEGWRVAIATRVNNMWRLVGVGSVV